MLNHISIMGRLVADPELRHTTNGTDVASFRIACERDFAKEGDEKKADFFSCVAWRSTAAFVARYFSKGSMIVIDGKLQQREYTDKDGNRRQATEIVADRLYFGDRKKDGDGSGTGTWANKTAMYPAPTDSGGFVEVDGPEDGDLPF